MTGRARRWPALAIICAKWRSPKATKSKRRSSLGYDVYGYGVGDLVKAVREVSDAEIDQLVQAYLDEYDVAADAAPRR